MTLRLPLFFLLFHLLLIGLFLYLNQKIFIINFEIAFFVAVVIIFASYRGYEKMINHSIDNDVQMEVKDPLDAIEDPYDLYDDEEEIDPKELKRRMKKDGFKKMIKSSKGHASWKRVASYALLVLSFIALKNSDALSISGYLLGLTAGIVTATWLGYRFLRS